LAKESRIVVFRERNRRGSTTPVSLVTFVPIDILYEVSFAHIDNQYETMKGKKADLLQGTLHLLVLQALAPQPLHGLGVSQRINQITKQTFEVKPGSLFPALHRMEEAGWLKSYWGESENNRRAKFYTLTKAGVRQLETETEGWERISLGISNALSAS
jgi:PadR family transcriptional regulator PadR